MGLSEKATSIFVLFAVTSDLLPCLPSFVDGARRNRPSGLPVRSPAEIFSDYVEQTAKHLPRWYELTREQRILIIFPALTKNGVIVVVHNVRRKPKDLE